MSRKQALAQLEAAALAYSAAKSAVDEYPGSLQGDGFKSLVDRRIKALLALDAAAVYLADLAGGDDGSDAAEGPGIGGPAGGAAAGGDPDVGNAT